MLADLLSDNLLSVAIVVFAIVAIVGALIYDKKKKSGGANPQPKEQQVKEAPQEKMPYLLKKSVLTDAELRFSAELVKYVSPNSIILTKVSLHDVFEVDKVSAGKDYLAFFNRFSSKHVDFLVCDRTTFAPQYGVELDDSTNTTNQRTQQRDVFLEKLYNHVGLKLVRIPAKHHYSERDFPNLPK